MLAPSLKGRDTRATLAQKTALAAEICLTYVRVRYLLSRHDTPATVEILRSTPVRRSEREPRLAELEETKHLARATVRVLRRLPIDSRCLLRSLVLARLMVRRSLEFEIVFSVRGGDAFEAHCWVENGGVPVLVPGGAEHAVVMRL